MRYNVKDIGEAGLDLDLTLGSAWLREHCADLEGEVCGDGLRLIARLEPTGDDFLLRGTLRGAFSLSCVRCLEAVEVPIDVDVLASFVAGPEPSRGGARPAVEMDDAAEGEGDFVVFTGDVIDLSGELREELLLALPMNPAHDPPCLGLCPVCGGNRDRQPCACAEQARAAASPFSALARLKS